MGKRDATDSGNSYMLKIARTIVMARYAKNVEHMGGRWLRVR
jgi:hypothetical protein